ncbi:hypothetical protein HOE04_04295 [archaeon]|nr:hypothetical protein [archaeon]
MTKPVSEYDPEDKKKLYGAGLQPLEINPSGPFCKYAINNQCEGIQDLDPVRCHISNNENCLVYQLKEHQNDASTEKTLAMSDSLEDTVEITQDQIINETSYDEPIHDSLADERYSFYVDFTKQDEDPRAD